MEAKFQTWPHKSQGTVTVFAAGTWGPRFDLQHLPWKARHVGTFLQCKWRGSRGRGALVGWQPNWWAPSLMSAPISKLWTQPLASPNQRAYVCGTYTSHRQMMEVFSSSRQVLSPKYKCSWVFQNPALKCLQSQAFHWEQTRAQSIWIGHPGLLDMIVYLRVQEKLHPKTK